MSHTTTAPSQPAQQPPAPQQPAPPPTYDAAWLVPVLKEIGIRDQVRNVAVPTLAVKPNRPQLPPAAAGKGRSKMPLADTLRSIAMGSSATRKTISNASTTEIFDMQREGLAAPVSLQANGRNLNGNFFSAEGHNLKQSGGQPDLTRPAVLLLTGSHGSAQDQGLDLAKFYAKNGASVLSVNYGGFGNSTDANGGDVTPTEESLNQDAREMLQHLVDLGYKTEDIVIHGFSLGGAIGGKLKEEMEAGPPIDQSDPPGQGAPNPAPIKFRGAAMDRPMLSMAHGVMSHVPVPGASRAAASYSRQALGKFGARGAIERSANTDTRMVVTSDQGTFGRKADEMRQRLQAQAQGGNRAAVTGAASGQDHMAHGPAIAANENALKDLVRKDRADQPQNVQSTAGPGASQLSSALVTQINNEVANLASNVTAVSAKVAEYAQAMPTLQAVDYYILKAEGSLKKALDMSRNMPQSLAVFRTQAEQAAESLQESMVALLGMRATLAQAQQGGAQQGGPQQAPQGPPAALIDGVSDRCQKALAALAAAQGPAPGNVALEDKVLECDATMTKLQRNNFPQQLATDLANARTQIDTRRTAERRAVQAAQAARQQRRARRIGQGPEAVRRVREARGQQANAV